MAEDEAGQGVCAAWGRGWSVEPAVEEGAVGGAEGDVGAGHSCCC